MSFFNVSDGVYKMNIPYRDGYTSNTVTLRKCNVKYIK